MSFEQGGHSLKAKNNIQSVDRTLKILEILSDYNEGLRVVDISEQTNLNKSTVHRMLGTLISNSYVTQDSETKLYKLTFKLFELGNKRLKNEDLLSASKLYTKGLMKITNEVIHLTVRDGNEVVYIDKVEANNTIRMASSIGKRSQMYCTAVGKAILGYLPQHEILKIWESSKIEKLTKNSIISYGKLEAELQKIKKQGYAIDNEENELGVRCVGAPIFNREGKVEAAISVSGPAVRVTISKVEKIAKEVKKTAYLISKELGYIEMI